MPTEPVSQVSSPGVRRDDLHRAGNRVAAVERALGAAQHFDALHVEQVQVHAGEPAVVDVVHVDADGRLGEIEARVLDAGTAGVDLDGLGARRHRVGLEVGDVLADVLDHVDLPVGDLVDGEGADGHGHVLEALLPALGRDEDLVDLRRRGARPDGQRQAGQHAGCRRGKTARLHAQDSPIAPEGSPGQVRSVDRKPQWRGDGDGSRSARAPATRAGARRGREAAGRVLAKSRSSSRPARR